MTACGYIAILGAPNAGKSTLMNQLVGAKLAIATPKEQTTRGRIMGILMQGETQMIFLDTPGIFAAPKAFEKAMVNAAWDSADDADLVLFLLDAERGMDERSTAILDRLKGIKKPLLLVLNKIDEVEKTKLLTLAKDLNEQCSFAHTFMISALKGDGLEKMKETLAGMLPEGPLLYPEDQLSDVPQRVLASEITREKLFMRLNQELPYSLAVETEEWKEKKGRIRISQVIYVERESQKTIIIGKGGAMLKAIGTSARLEMVKQFDAPVDLFLFVKVSKDWKDNKEMYALHGLRQG